MATQKPGRQKSAIIVGAGVGGVSTAARLAKAGFAVTVYEKNDFTGGRCSLLHHQPDDASSPSKTPYRFDQGPSLVLLPHLFERTFAELGTSLAAEGVELRKCDPNYTVHFGDGESFRLSSDLAVMKTEIEKWEGKDGFDRYLGYLQEAHRHYEISVEQVLLKNFTGLASMLRLGVLGNLLALHPFESIWQRARGYFWTERLRRVFTFGSMYMGMSPFEAPGTYSLLQYTELAEGIWYPVGGFWKVVEALVKVGEREGVEIKLGTAVESILLDVDGESVKGVRLAGGEEVFADVVVNNSDLVYAYNHLLPQSAYAESLAGRPGSCSSISFYWALDRQVPELGAHNIFLANEYQESFDAIFKKHLIPEEPSFYVNVPSRVDASAAPTGKDSVVVLVPVGHLQDSQTTDKAEPGLQPSERQDWPAMIALARRTILSTISARIGVDLTPLIVHEQTNTPLTWKKTFNLDKGAILGLSHSFFNVLCFRPTTRARRPSPYDGCFKSLGLSGRVAEVILDAFRGSARDVRGLYMVGASSHPGTGVPIVLAGGALVSEQICADFGVAVPWRQSEAQGSKWDAEEADLGKDGEMDRIERPNWVARSSWFGLLVLALVWSYLSQSSWAIWGLAILIASEWFG